jgi:hypothetical protein
LVDRENRQVCRQSDVHRGSGEDDGEWNPLSELLPLQLSAFPTQAMDRCRSRTAVSES